jgi:crotonobetaine/carnitine-CoA ligase
MRIKQQQVPWSTIPDLVRDKASLHGDAICATIDGKPMTYRELDRASDRIAAALAALGLGKGDVVASVLHNCPEQVLAWVGTNKIGGIWAPLNAGLVGLDLEHALRDSGARIVIVEEETEPKLHALAPDLLRALPIFVVGTPSGRVAAQPFDRLTAAGDPPPQPQLSAADPMMIIYTGGTTGLPKGVVLPHFSFIAAGYRYRETYGLAPGDCHFSTLPLFHAAGAQQAFICPFLNDMTTVIDRRFSASVYWDRVRETGAAIIDPISTIMTVLVQQPATPRDRDHRVKIGISVTGQIPGWVAPAFSERFGIPLVEIYGLSEAGGAMVTSNRLADKAPGTHGKPHGWSEVRIVDEEDEPVPAGELGEIVLRPVVPYSFMLGYHNQPKLTAETCRNMWLHTGDRGYLDPAGNLVFAGRHAHWLRRRGENISAYEVESILSQHEGVREVIVVGVPGELGDEEVKACIVAADVVPTPVELVAWCGERMAAFKIPRFIEFVADFPRSATKREVERHKVKAWPNDEAWDRERALGRTSTQSSRRSATIAAKPDA